MNNRMGDEVRVGHMLESIGYIEQFLSGKTRISLDEEPMLRFALERQLEIIGEASNHITQRIKELYPEMDWTKIRMFRNIVAHEYFGIDHDVVWEILQDDIPSLKIFLLRIQTEQNFTK